jgi:predicted ATPase/class 3 adenylate cyclase
MDFVAVVDQVIALLRQRGRVTYSTLKRQFQLDDAALEDVKNELIEGQRLAVDERSNVLVWTGDAPSPPTPSPPTSPQASPPATPEAERRQLTVLFCDLVGSTALAAQLDPEDLREVVRAYQDTCAKVIARFEGHIAQYLGDGLLVYFGYPQAHEDDAQRAVRAGLGMLAALGDLHQSLSQAKGIHLAVRVGIHTGLVVVGEMGGAGRQEQLALGEVPNVAARLQGLAASNTLVVSPATYRLIQGYFECQDLGAQPLRGVAEPVHTYRVLQASAARGRLDVAVTRGLTPLVGRDAEVTLLLERWEQAKGGHGQVVLLSGEAGIGKSRLVQTLKDQIANTPSVRWECRSAEYSQNTALFPLTDLFQRLWRLHAAETSDAKLGKLEQALRQYRLPLEESVPLLAPLLALPLPETRYPLRQVSPQRQRQQTLETIVALLLEQAEHHPALFIVEDLHWTDPSTLELISLLLDQTPTASLCVLLTCRPHFQPAWHHRSYLTEITVPRLAHAQVGQIVTGLTHGRPFPAAVLQQIVAKTDGVPLFIEELTKAILESGHLQETEGHYELVGALRTLTIPATLQDSLMARLDHLISAKGIAQLGAAIGRQFAYDVLQVVSQLDEGTLRRELHRLVEAEIVYQRGMPPQATYVFKHALMQEAAYESLLKRTRQQYHQRIAEVVEAHFPEIGETQPEFLAHHYTGAGLHAQAVPYWQRAGERAIQRSANVEAIAHLTRGLELLTTLPDTPERRRQELDVHIALGAPLTATRGWGAPEVQHAYTRARALCQDVGDTPQLARALFGLWTFYEYGGELLRSQEVAEELLQLAQSVREPDLLLRAHRALGGTLFWCGALVPALVHLEQGTGLYDPAQHRSQAFQAGHSAAVACLSHAARSLWPLGYPVRALQKNQAALALAHEVAHPASLAYAHAFAAMLHQLRQEGQAVREQAEAAIAISHAQGLAQTWACGMILRGWALADQGQAEQGLADMRQGLDSWRRVAQLAQPYWLALLAEAYSNGGQLREGLTALEQALALVEQNEERYYEAELHRLKGELLLRQVVPDEEGAETCARQALEVARRQQAKSWELRAAMSLSRLWQHQGQRGRAYKLLAPIYGWFTEGFDTADLQEAKALLEEFSG